MNKDEIYNLIISWEQDAGESFLDQGFNLNERTFMTWCMGRGYLSPAKYDLWVTAYVKNDLEAVDANYYVYAASDYVGSTPFAVVSSDRWNEEDQEKAYRILSEFISEITIYQERLLAFIEE